MKREAALQGENKKSLILRVANAIFVENGFERASVSQIAKRANISDGNIYNYFKSKEDILFSIPEERMERFLVDVQEHLKGLKGAPNKLRKLIWYHLNFYESNRDYTRLLLIDLRQNPRFNKSKAYKMIREYSKVILQIIEEGKREKSIRKEADPYMIRDLILGGIEHIAIRGLIMGKLSDMKKTADGLYDLVLCGAAEKARMVSLTVEEFVRLKGIKGRRVLNSKRGEARV
jgi:TetR/AcrR family transcriptional regulator, fatty acid metabolism regulator protein